MSSSTLQTLSFNRFREEYKFIINNSLKRKKKSPISQSKSKIYLFSGVYSSNKKPITYNIQNKNLNPKKLLEIFDINGLDFLNI